MKILALTFLFILLFFRIKNTPYSLSKTLWKKKTTKQLEKNKKSFNGKPIGDAIQGAVIVLMLLIELIFIIFYIVLGSKIGTKVFMILSALQVFTCFWTLYVSMNEFKTSMTSYDINDYKFHRFQLLFNLILDYIYYPYAIYMLLR